MELYSQRRIKKETTISVGRILRSIKEFLRIREKLPSFRIGNIVDVEELLFYIFKYKK